MKDKIRATLTKDHIYKCPTSVIGRGGENKCTQLEITLDECLCDKWVYIDFVKPNGSKYKTPKLDVVENKVTYDISNSLLQEAGHLRVQVVLQNEKGEVWKSNIKIYNVIPSINATDDIPNQDDFITEAQKLINEFEDVVDVIKVDGTGNKYLSDDGTYKLVTGGGGTSGTSNYRDLEEKPSINNVELVGNKTLDELGIQPKGDYATETYVTNKIAEAELSGGDIDLSGYATKGELNEKQDLLVSGTNIKTINNQIILGSGNIEIQGGSGSYTLPIASADTLGGIKVGNNLSIDANGVLSASGGGGGATQEFNYIHLTTSAYQDITTAMTYTKILYDTVKSSNGSKFSLDNNGVLIGAGVSKVRVTAQVGVQNKTPGYDQKALKLLKNEENMSTTYTVTHNSQYASGLLTIATIIDVKEGDHLYLQASYSTIQSSVLPGAYNTFIVEALM